MSNSINREEEHFVRHEPKLVILLVVMLIAGLSVAVMLVSRSNDQANQSSTELAVVSGPSLVAGALELRPAAKAPANGGKIKTRERFVLELWVNGDKDANLVGQQSYLTFTNSLLQNAQVFSIGTSCTLTSTLTPDVHVFDVPLQNEVCNGPQPCVFRGTKIPAGSIAFASGALGKPAAKGSFRVAEVGLCAVAPGQARIHWQLSPPEPPQRGTRLVTEGSTSVPRNMQLADYVITVVGSSK